MVERSEVVAWFYINAIVDFNAAENASEILKFAFFWEDSAEGPNFWTQISLVLENEIGILTRQELDGCIADSYTYEYSTGYDDFEPHPPITRFCKCLTNAFDFQNNPQACQFWYEVAVRFVVRCGYGPVVEAQHFTSQFFPNSVQPPQSMPITHRVNPRHLKLT